MPIKNINAICRVDGRVRLYPVKEEEEEVKNFARHAFKSADLKNRERNPSIRVLRGREGGEKGRREKKGKEVTVNRHVLHLLVDWMKMFIKRRSSTRNR